jgi:hypothetical protein
MAKLGVLVMHGMGDQKSDFANEMIEELDDRLSDEKGIDKDDVCWKPIHWAPVLSAKENDLWVRLSRKNEMDFVALRKFVINALGDAVAYQRVPWQSPSVYEQIHQVVYKGIQQLRLDLGDQDFPLMVMAHSLGGVIISDYIWDRQKFWNSSQSDPKGANDFEAMKTLSGIITFGCNIPIFSLAYNPVQAIDFPPDAQQLVNYFPSGTEVEKLKKAVQWTNYYDPDDILGYPLKDLSPSYKKAVNKDTPINVGNILTSWNPMSHSGYWTDNDFTKPVTKAIAKILKLL